MVFRLLRFLKCFFCRQPYKRHHNVSLCLQAIGHFSDVGAGEGVIISHPCSYQCTWKHFVSFYHFLFHVLWLALLHLYLCLWSFEDLSTRISVKVKEISFNVISNLWMTFFSPDNKDFVFKNKESYLWFPNFENSFQVHFHQFTYICMSHYVILDVSCLWIPTFTHVCMYIYMHLYYKLLLWSSDIVFL